MKKLLLSITTMLLLVGSIFGQTQKQNQILVTYGSSSTPTCALLPGVNTTNLQFDHVAECLSGVDNTVITSWPDASSNANDLITWTGNTVKKTNILNGWSVARTVTADSPVLTTSIAVTNFTYIAVIKDTTSSGQQTLISGNTGSVQVRINTLKTNVLKTATADMGSETTALVVSTFHIVGVTYDGITVRFFRDGVADGTNATVQLFTANLRGIFINFANGVENFTGDMAEELFWTDAKSSSEMIYGGGGATDKLRTRYAPN